MVFVDQTYITVARKTEAAYHEQKVTQLERTIKHLTDALAWEHQQHRARLLELETVEGHITTSPSSKTIQSDTKQPTLKAHPSSRQKWSQVRKHHRHHGATPALPKAG
ncbi:MAG: hypothetical protein KC563_11815 [Nitrospira sp.]|nr:hypothetical protein [Nitrospira sp.]MCA9476472.1 hypothetical protein [Nitrospira sp.]MCA9481171.1 hypothetical protein [Nitrospira sp.]MDR4489177.1 hypothetical protein [Nitrospirales bacterium]HQU28700.1 hypothetical protein [Nitrospirales bacterium]